MTYFFYLIRTAFTKNPMDTWDVATTAERVALLLMGVFLVADTLAFNVFDMVLDVLVILFIYLFVWDEVEIIPVGEDEDAG